MDDTPPLDTATTNIQQYEALIQEWQLLKDPKDASCHYKLFNPELMEALADFYIEQTVKNAFIFTKQE